MLRAGVDDAPDVVAALRVDVACYRAPGSRDRAISSADTGALAPKDIENAVRSQAATDLATDGIQASVDNVQCLTGGPPLIYPATTLCHATSNIHEDVRARCHIPGRTSPVS
ncbi:hypothetical protein [Rhodococcus sp. AG1013]|uniref:hypothetical protein n=1 Tax=unclassified Rhodococcus (in: high G+C Gram-positive bacteria) TaxID=192944 RepID=UPI000E0B195A|nr:hypothetical protein [Rhodococcus sp. AG1013]RDI23167.1 hypothetical protein DEU38_11231 [Rhodococcus sp. AG1013]